MYAKKINIHCVIFTFSQFTDELGKSRILAALKRQIIIIRIFRMYEKYFGIKIVVLFASDRSIHTVCVYANNENKHEKLLSLSFSNIAMWRRLVFAQHNNDISDIIRMRSIRRSLRYVQIDSQWNNNDAQLTASSSFITVRRFAQKYLSGGVTKILRPYQYGWCTSVYLSIELAWPKIPERNRRGRCKT